MPMQPPERTTLKARAAKSTTETESPKRSEAFGTASDARGSASGALHDASQPRGDKYQRILDAAVEVIAEHGYFNSPVSAIAARAGVADGTIYLYFKSKDQVLRTAIDAVFRGFFASIRLEIDRIPDAREQLRAVARLHLEGLASHRSLAVLLQTELRQSAKFVADFSHQHMKDYLNLIREVVRRGQEQGVFREDVSDRVAAHCLFGALDEMVSAWVFTGRAFDPDATATQVLEVVVGGLARRDRPQLGTKDRPQQ